MTLSRDEAQALAGTRGAIGRLLDALTPTPQYVPRLGEHEAEAAALSLAFRHMVESARAELAVLLRENAELRFQMRSLHGWDAALSETPPPTFQGIPLLYANPIDGERAPPEPDSDPEC